jgi:hypothetical protein
LLSDKKMTFRRRNEFSSITKREAYARSGGACECHLLAKHGVPGFYATGCSRPLGEGNTFYEHIDPDAICGRNDLENCAVMTKTCWLAKTNGYDKPTIAKANRRRDKSRGIRPLVHDPIPGTKASGVKFPVNQYRREPIDRRTGQPFKGRG